MNKTATILSAPGTEPVVNHPAISDPSAMSRFPDARNAERDALLDYVDLRRGMRTLDIQSAGGYLSDEIFRRLEGDVDCLCLEPCDELRGRLDPRFRAIGEPVEKFPGIAGSSVDAAFGLAGLHHSESHAATLAECHRVLVPGGRLAICDVEADTHVARWLNEFVDANNPAGHEGRFVRAGAMSELFRETGFTDITEERRAVPWRFPDRESISIFFRGLFGLVAEPAEIDSVLDDYFIVTGDGSGNTCVNWELLYAAGRKPS